jgi:hypothetical protein
MKIKRWGYQNKALAIRPVEGSQGSDSPVDNPVGVDNILLPLEQQTPEK